MSGEYVADLMMELLAVAREEFPEDHPFRRIGVTPGGIDLPPVWMLGSSGGSARMAGELGTGYAFAAHFSHTPARPAIDACRAAFTPSATFPEPRVILALSVICADSDDEAMELGSSVTTMFRRLRSGDTGPLPSPEEARASGWTPPSSPEEAMGGLLITGSPATVRPRIERAAQEAAAEEVMVMTIVHDPAARLRSYQLLAEELLGPG